MFPTPPPPPPNPALTTSPSTSNPPPSPTKQQQQQQPPLPLFSPLPPIYILPTHLLLPTLHAIEDALVRRAARLTYDAAEAQLVLGKVGQKKRAVVELRARGVWTVEVKGKGEGGDDGGRPVKRRRVEGAEERGGDDVVTEGEMKTKTEREVGPESTATSASATLMDTLRDKQDLVTVIRLDWLDEVLQAQRLVPMDSFVVYQGRKIAPPTTTRGAPVVAGGAAKSGRSDTTTTTTTSTGILERARQDAMSQSQSQSPGPPHSHRFTARRSHSPHATGLTSQGYPPKLHHQTTSEHDTAAAEAEAAPLPPIPDWVRNGVNYACMRSAPLHPPNEAFITQLVKIRTVRELTLDEIGVRAYSTAIAALAAYPYRLRQPSEILRLPGCDAKIAALFAEFQASAHTNTNNNDNDNNNDSGTLAAATALTTDPTLRTLHLFHNIWGVGAKTARAFYYTHHWRDLSDIVEHGWSSLSRVQQIGLKYYDEFLAGIPRAESAAIARVIGACAARVRPCADPAGFVCVLVGGYRRGKVLSGDVDVVLSHRDPAVTRDLVLDVVRRLESDGYVTHTLALHMTASRREQQTVPYSGDDGGGDVPKRHFDSLDKALVVWQDPEVEAPSTPTPTPTPPSASTHTETDNNSNDNNNNNRDKETIHNRPHRPHRRVDIIISPWRTIGCAILGWTGATTFERDLRRWAKKAHGWKFDSSGVRRRMTGGQVVDLERGGETWEERERLVMEGLGVGWRPPEERCTR